MMINKQSFDSFGAILVSFSYSPPSFNGDVFYNKFDHLYVSEEIGTKKQRLVVVFDRIRNMSEFIQCTYSRFELDIGDGYTYDCLLISDPEMLHIGGDVYQVTFPLSVVKKGHRRMILLDKISNKCSVDGDCRCGCIYEITPTIDMSQYSVNGIKIKKLYKDRTVYLDGISKKIYSTYETNKYNDVELVDNEFPSIDPGRQVISIGNTSANVILKYDPIFF